MFQINKQIITFVGFIFFVAVLGIRLYGADNVVLISEILAEPQKYVNATITIKGLVMNVNAEPAGTTRGTYKVTDDSGEQELIVKTKNLPMIGKTFTIVGVVVMDSTTSDPFIKELSRKVPASLFIYIAIGAAVLLILVIVLLVITLGSSKKAKSKPVAQPVVGSTIKPTISPSTVVSSAATSVTPKFSDKTVIVQPGKSAGVTGNETIVALSVRAELIGITGKDSGKRFMLLKAVTTIGRGGGRTNDIELSESTVSREQAKITFDQNNKVFTLINESITNPSKVNGEQVSSKVLADNDEIEFGFCKSKFRIIS